MDFPAQGWVWLFGQSGIVIITLLLIGFYFWKIQPRYESQVKEERERSDEILKKELERQVHRAEMITSKFLEELELNTKELGKNTQLLNEITDKLRVIHENTKK